MIKTSGSPILFAAVAAHMFLMAMAGPSCADFLGDAFARGGFYSVQVFVKFPCSLICDCLKCMSFVVSFILFSYSYSRGANSPLRGVCGLLPGVCLGSWFCTGSSSSVQLFLPAPPCPGSG